MAATFHLEPGIPLKSLDAVVGADNTAGIQFGVPARTVDGPRAFTWRISWNNNPSAVSMALEGTLDFTNWFSLDTSTNTSGEAKTVVDKVVKGVRARIVTMTPHGSGTLTTVDILIS